MGGAVGAFTLIETMVVMGIIAILASIVLLAIRHVRSTGDVTSEVGMVSSLQKAAEQFKQQFGFPPPLVNDSAPGPVTGAGRIVVWQTSDLADPATAVNGGNRWSQYSLAYYIAGALDEDYDGAKGLGYTAPNPNHDGNFTKRGRKFDPFMDPTTQRTRSGANRLYNAAPMAANAQGRANCVILDRWSDGTASNNRPIRYYRWLPTYYTDPQLNQPNPAPTPALIGKVKDHNVPPVLGDPAVRPELRDAEYAIVSAGPDRKFGDEGAALDVQAMKDNIMEVGK
jgi:prepilin-type N-terminal cleavage/methylation domain-containing protein